MLGLGVALAARGEAPDNALDIANARQAISEWVQVERTISDEKQDWEQEREMMEELVEVNQRRIESLREQIQEAEENITAEDESRADLIEKNDRLKKLSENLKASVAQFEDRMRHLLARVPAPATDIVKPLSQRMPKDPEKTGQSLSQRFQNTIGILNELDKFNQKVTVTSEVREVEGGRSEVTALYLGLGQAYYVGGDGRIGGYGTADEGQWRWHAASDAAPSIANAIAIYENEQAARFVLLPIDVE